MQGVNILFTTIHSPHTIAIFALLQTGLSFRLRSERKVRTA